MTEATQHQYGPPLPGDITYPRAGSRAAFGYQRSPTHVHQGIDLRAPLGTPWQAVADGVIRHTRTGPDDPTRGFAGYGRIAVLEHIDEATGRPVQWLYAHGQDVGVHVGDQVRRGDILGHVGNSQYTHEDPTLDGRMAPHLHLEASTHTYPQGSEARTRVDPATLLRALSSSRRGPASPPVRRPSPGVASADFRRALMRRLALTDQAVSRASAELSRAGYPAPAALLLETWTRLREPILAALRRPGPVAAIQSAVNAWLAELRELATQARALVPALSSRISRLEAYLLGLWQHAIDWARQTAGALAAAGGMGLLMVALLFLWSKSK